MSSAAAPSVSAAVDWSRARAGLAVSLGAFLLVVAIGGADGGYFPTTWGWCVLAFGWVAGLALIVGARGTFGRLELCFLASLALLIGWVTLSLLWSSDVDQSFREVQRGLIYLVGVLAVVLVVRGTAVVHLLGGLLAGIFWLSSQALASRLSPGSGPGAAEVDVGRLADPIGYFNALGLFAVMGALLALGFAVHGRRLSGRAAAAAALPVLLTTAYFTFSRGAVLALAVGLLAAVSLNRQRLTFITSGVLVALPAAAAVWLASHASALTSVSAPRSAIADDGKELAAVLVASMIASAGIALVVGTVERRVLIPTRARRAYATVLACVALLLISVAVIDQGGPGTLARKAYDGINKTSSGAATSGNDLNTRLGSIGSSERVAQWRVAWNQYEQHPWIGSGAGTSEQFWLRDRRTAFQARDAHSLYLETLAELGWPGLALLLIMLSLPVLGAVRARGRPLVAAAFGAYAAYLVHAGIDWQWEIPVVTLIALSCGVALIAARADRAAPRWRISTGGRVLGLAAVVVVTLFSVVGLVGNRALADAADAVDTRDFRGAEAAARTALRWAPWSAEAHQQLGRAQVGLGRREQGRSSLQTAAKMNPGDWLIWYDLAIASSGRQRQRAFVKAATLNPLETDIEVLRKQGVRLPPRPAAR